MNEIKYNDLSKKQKNICDAAKELAKKSDMEKSQHGAIIVNGSKILGEGFNHHYNDNNKKKCYSCHAEVVAIVDAIKKYGKESLYNSELYVIRISKGNNIAKQHNKKYRQDTSKKDISRQDTLRQDTLRQDTLRQDTRKQDTLRQDTLRQDTLRQDTLRQDTLRQDKSKQDKSKQDTSRQDKSRQDKSRQDKTRQDKSRQDKSRQDTSRQDTSKCDFRMSKPCQNCTNFIIKNNINTVFYSID
jgi:pentapeptide MXKDX repeat protein